LIGESIAKQEWPTYIAIWLALGLLALEGLLKLYRNESLQTNQDLG